MVFVPKPQIEAESDDNLNTFSDNLLMETLRLRPVFRIQRQATCDTIVGPGIELKKGEWTVFLCKCIRLKFSSTQSKNPESMLENVFNNMASVEQWIRL